jgi:hypothetical protein
MVIFLHAIVEHTFCCVNGNSHHHALGVHARIAYTSYDRAVSGSAYPQKLDAILTVGRSSATTEESPKF